MLENAKKAEQKQMSEIDSIMREVDALKQKKSFLKSECDKLEDEVNAARRDVGAVAKEMQSANKLVSQLENQIESERATRHSILFQCKMDNIEIPIKRGSLDDIDDDQGEDPSMEVICTYVYTCRISNET